MATPFVHFVLGSVGSLLLFLLLARLSGVKGFSFPSASIVVGIACASMAHFLSPWATPVILALYAISSLYELRQENRQS